MRGTANLSRHLIELLLAKLGSSHSHSAAQGVTTLRALEHRRGHPCRIHSRRLCVPDSFSTSHQHTQIAKLNS